MNATDLAVIPAVIAAMGGILKLVLNYLDRADERQAKMMNEMRTGFEAFLGNHMSKNTAALENLTRATVELVQEVKSLKEEL